MSSQFKLLKERRFLPFFISQFLSAFNDNLYKNALVVLFTFHTVRYLSDSSQSGVLVNISFALFMLPYFLFSATSGQLADKYEKSRLIRLTKVLEIIIMLIATVGFVLDSLHLMLTALFLLGTQSAVFSPVKYAYLPQTVHETELIGGNALLESGTFIAILLGTLLGTVLPEIPNGVYWVSGTCIAMSVIGYLVSFGIPITPAVAPELRIDWNPITSTISNVRYTTERRAVFLSILGISWFWFYGSVLLPQLPDLVKNVFHADRYMIAVLLATFSISVGVGSLLCERLSGKQIEIGLVPLGSIGLTLFAFDLWFANRHVTEAPLQAYSLIEMMGGFAFWRVLIDLMGIGIFSGFFIVPLYAMMQTRSDRSNLSRIVAGNNIINAIFMVIAAGMVAALLKLGFSVPEVFLALCVLNVAVCCYIYYLLPEFTIRFIVWSVVSFFYRLKVKDIDKIPETGAALLICNHPSFIDALVITAACRRPIRFVMDYNMYKRPIIHYVFKGNRAIPIATAREDIGTLKGAYDEIDAALKNGELVGIFPEGHASYTGELDKFQGGISKILRRTPVPVIPMALRGMWGSFFSRIDGSVMSKPFRRGVFNKIELIVGDAIAPETATPPVLFAAVSELRGEFK